MSEPAPEVTTTTVEPAADYGVMIGELRACVDNLERDVAELKSAQTSTEEDVERVEQQVETAETVAFEARSEAFEAEQAAEMAAEVAVVAAEVASEAEETAEVAEEVAEEVEAEHTADDDTGEGVTEVADDAPDEPSPSTEEHNERAARKRRRGVYGRR